MVLKKSNFNNFYNFCRVIFNSIIIFSYVTECRVIKRIPNCPVMFWPQLTLAESIWRNAEKHAQQ